MSPLFSRSKRQATDASALADALAEHERQLDDIRAALSALRLEWAETMDKINRWASRQAARDRHALDRLAEAQASGEETASAELPPEVAEANAAAARAAQKAALRSRLRRGA